MAASTKSGLSGGFSGGGGPTDVQSARTLYGHDMHLRSALEAAAPVNEVLEEPQTDRVERPVTVEEEVATASDPIFPGHTGKSRFPALARLFGRWNTQGQFEQKFHDDDDLDTIPRDRFLRPLAIVVATAAISFFIVVGLLRLRDSTLAQPTAAARAVPAAEVIAPAAPPPAAGVTAPPAPVRPVEAARAPAAALPLPAPAPRAIELPPPTLAVKSATLAPAKRPVARRRPRPVPIDPDGPMPLSF